MIACARCYEVGVYMCKCDIVQFYKLSTSPLVKTFCIYNVFRSF